MLADANIIIIIMIAKRLMLVFETLSYNWSNAKSRQDLNYWAHNR